jgi:hypothetical protein
VAVTTKVPSVALVARQRSVLPDTQYGSGELPGDTRDVPMSAYVPKRVFDCGAKASWQAHEEAAAAVQDADATPGCCRRDVSREAQSAPPRQLFGIVADSAVANVVIAEKVPSARKVTVPLG